MCRGRWSRIYYTYIYNGKRQSCEGAEQVGVLVAETIHLACMCEGGGRRQEAAVDGAITCVFLNSDPVLPILPFVHV